MRIIDKNKDYYDFYQGLYPDAAFTYDRRGSVILGKDWFAEKLVAMQDKGYVLNDEISKCSIYFALLESGFDRWMLSVGFSTDEKRKDTVGQATVRLIEHWKEYDKEPKRLTLSLLGLGAWYLMSWGIRFRNRTVDPDYEREAVVMLKEGRIKLFESIRDPILKDSGAAGHIDAFGLYNSVEEYLSFLKTASERSESVGITDKEKILNHGFDLKDSFRGKNGKKK